MSFDSLRGAWQAAGSSRRMARPVADGAGPGDTAADAARAELQAARARAVVLDRNVRRRDLRESAVAAVMLPLFTWLALTAVTPMATLGASIVVAACVLIPLRLHAARVPRPDPSLPVLDAMRAEARAARAQERLLDTVLWWYFAPLGVGVALMVWGGTAGIGFRLTYLAGLVLLYGWLVYMNRRAVRRDVRPVAAELEHWLAELDVMEPGEESNEG